MSDNKPIDVNYVLVSKKKETKKNGRLNAFLAYIGKMWNGFWSWYEKLRIPAKWAAVLVVCVLLFMWIGGKSLNSWVGKKWDIMSISLFGQDPMSEDEKIRRVAEAKMTAIHSLEKMWSVINKNPRLEGIKISKNGTLTIIMPTKTSPEEEAILSRIASWAQKEYGTDCSIFGGCYEDWDGSAIWQDFAGGTDTSLEYMMFFAQEKYKVNKVCACINNPGNRTFPKPVVRQVNGYMSIEECQNRFMGVSWLWKTDGVFYKVKADNLDIVINGDSIDTKIIPGIESKPEDDQTLPEVRAVITSPFKFRKSQRI